MKLFGHPVHMMLIHFPAALFPMELLAYFIYFQTGKEAFGNASFYALYAGSILGWGAIVTGATDLVAIKNNGALQAKALAHGSINSLVIIAYSFIAFNIYTAYPKLPSATITTLVVKAVLNLVMIAGNYLGANLVIKHKIGVHN